MLLLLKKILTERNIFLWCACLFIFIKFSSDVFANECDTEALSISAERFDDNADGTLTDIESGLTWMRCALGQSWESGTCIGRPGLYSWQSALKSAKQLNINSSDDPYEHWRVPQLSELASIVERRCKNPRKNPRINPRINLSLFPATPTALFWSVNKKPNYTDRAYVLDFGNEGVQAVEMTEEHFVRLVRGRR